MQFLRVVTNQVVDGDGRITKVPWREAGVLQINDAGERLLSLHALPNLTFRIVDDSTELPVIR
jgi:hypothetical protein